MKMKRTPSPWHVGERWHVITDDEGKWLADTVTVNRLNGEEAENAKFIVRACNSHDQLVAALRDAKILLELNGVDLKDAADYGNGEHAYQTVRRIHEALDAAGEQS